MMRRAIVHNTKRIQTRRQRVPSSLSSLGNASVASASASAAGHPFSPSSSSFLGTSHKRRGMAVLAACTTGCGCVISFSNSSNKNSMGSSNRRITTTNCQSAASSPRRPPIFGTSIKNKRHFSSYNNSSGSTTSWLSDPNLNNITEDRKNCPICERYSQGPCGELFKTWLQCVDDHPGTIRTSEQETGEERHLSACATHAQALASCLEQHQAFYDNLPFHSDNLQEDSDDNGNDNHIEALHEAWEDFLRDELLPLPIPRREFPTPHKPRVEFRPTDRLAVVTLDVSMAKDDPPGAATLLMVFVQEEQQSSTTTTTTSTKKNTPKSQPEEEQAPLNLLCAGSQSDLHRYHDSNQKEVGILQCTIPKTTAQIQVSALYEYESHEQQKAPEQVIYTYSANVPTEL